ncbi:MAG: efflux transporter periplasmic adaptor subunit, partial [Brachymonas sp.]|nr:efflux transporter periplasmic adaptor subunit [Brachymonas sp.]
MKSSLKWIVIALALLAVAALGIWGLNKRQAAAAASAAAQSKAEPVVELAAADVMTLKTVELSQGVPISGSIKAVQSALVKAKVAGELAQL